MSLGARTGYAFAFGSARAGQSLASLAGGMLPLWFDLGYRVTRHVYLGAFFEYGMTFPPSAACPGGSCTGEDIRVGADAAYHFLPRAPVDPWAGLGVGYEIARVVTASGAGADQVTASMAGAQFVDLQLGADVHVVPRVAFGPFVDISLGRYSSFSAGSGAPTGSGDAGETFHEWLTLGVRGQGDL